MRKSLIIDAAMELFVTRPFHKIGMRDIANKAGISAAAIYRYFPSRDDILIEALIRHIKIVEKQFKAKVKERDTTLEELAIASVDYLIDNESVFQMIGHFMVTGHVNPGALEKYNQAQRYFLDVLENAKELDGVGGSSRIMIHAIYASIMGVVLTFSKYPGRTKEEIRTHIHRLSSIISSLFVTGKIPEKLISSKEQPA